MSIPMLKMPGDALVEPLFLIFKNCPKFGIFPDDWKKGNIVPIFQKDEKDNIKTIVQSLFFQSAARFPNVSNTIC